MICDDSTADDVRLRQQLVVATLRELLVAIEGGTQPAPRLTGPADAPLGVKVAQAAKMLGESKNTIYRLLASGQLRAVKRGATTLILMSSIHGYFGSLPPAQFGTDRPAA